MTACVSKLFFAFLDQTNFSRFVLPRCIDAVDKVAQSGKKGGCLLQPPTPIMRSTKWPTREVSKTTLEDYEGAADEYVDEEEEAEQARNVDLGNSWENEGFDEAPQTSAVAAAMDDLDLDDDMGDWDDDLDLGDDMGEPDANEVDEMAGLADIGNAGFKVPDAGRPPAACWSTNSSHAAIHIAGGGSAKALQLLNRQIAACEFDKLKGAMMGSYLGSFMSVPGVPGSGSISIPLLANDKVAHPGTESLPRTSLKLKNLVDGVRSGYRLFQTGKFNDSKAAFMSVMTDIPLVVTDNRNEANEVKEMLEICREYITAIRIKGAISENASSSVRTTELSAYFTHCNLQPSHLLLALRSAMGTAFKNKNFISAASFARRLLELPDMSGPRNADLRVKATKVLQKSESIGRNSDDLNYDETSTFKIDCKDFVPIYATDVSVKCSFCGSEYKGESMRGLVCKTCNFSKVGVQTIGLVTGS